MLQAKGIAHAQVFRQEGTWVIEMERKPVWEGWTEMCKVFGLYPKSHEIIGS